MKIRFGPAGNSESFSAKGYKTNMDIPKYLFEFSLNAYEYQCGRGVRISKDSANAFGQICQQADIALSIHAPYYISLSSLEEEKRDKSIEYITDSAIAADAMGASRIIVHSGSCGKLKREDALVLAVDTLKRARVKLDEIGLSHIHICPETMGKINQLGDLQEVIALCQIDERMIPCIDFGHLNARTFGGIKSEREYAEILDAIENNLGIERLKIFHSHFSKIEYTDNGGEKRHLTFEDKIYGPQFEPLAELVAKRQLTPTFICESAGTQAEDAAAMRQIYLSK